jgi:hypothetical protein
MHSERRIQVIDISPPPDPVSGFSGDVDLSHRRSSRSRQMIHVLRQEFVYSEKRARDTLFDEIENVLRRVGPMMLSRLTREAALGARDRRNEIAFKLFNWSTAAQATTNAMLAAGAFLARNGEPILRTVAAQATDVAELISEYRDMTEAYLVETLIRRLGDVTARDHIAMAHALFRQFDPSVSMEAMEDRVAWLLARLAKRVAIEDMGRYIIRPAR